jgi:hypothetical protein
VRRAICFLQLSAHAAQRPPGAGSLAVDQGELVRMRFVLIYTLGVLAVLLSPAGRTEDAATDTDSLRLFWAKSSETDLATVVIGDFDASPESNYVVGLNWGTPLSSTLFGLPIPLTANFGVQHLAERGYQADGVGATAFIKANYLWRLPFTHKHIRLGLGEGLSYVSRIPMSEQRDFAKKGVTSEKLMNYLEWSIDLPLDQFATFKPLMQGGRIKELSLGYVVWHRSSVFGLFAEERGGVNFMGFGIEARY